MSTDILARQLGIGTTEDWLEAVAAQMDHAFHLSGPVGDRAAIVSLHNDGRFGMAMCGDDALVTVESTTADGVQLPPQTTHLGQVWRLPAAGLMLSSVVPITTANTAFGIAESWDARTASLVVTVVSDQRGAAVVLLDPSTYRTVFPPSSKGETGRAFDYAKKVEGSAEMGSTAPRTIVASAAHEYLAGQHAEHTDDGERPLWWYIAVSTGDGVRVLSSSGDLVGSGPHRLGRIRTAGTDALARDLSGRTRPDALGSSRRWVSLSPDGTTRQGGYVANDPDRQMRVHGDHKARLSWHDPTGEEACNRAEGHRPEITTVAELRALGLTDRQASVLAADLNGFTNREIGDALGIEPSTVAATKAAATNKLSKP
jgi:regulatory LuxR family protein